MAVIETITPTTTHKLLLTKNAVRALQDKVIEGNVSNLLASVNTRAINVRGWVLRIDPIFPLSSTWRRRDSAEKGFTYRYEMFLAIDYTSDRTPEPNELDRIIRTLSTRCGQPQFGRWELAEVDAQPWSATPEAEVVKDDALGYAPVVIPADFEEHFSHLYGLDSHITMVKRAVEAGLITNWSNRSHCVLVGPPGCGKSDLSQSLKRALGEEAVMELDATSTTRAGAEKELTEREVLPRILIIEEIEKAEEKTMSFLLSLMDQRAEIRKTTARASVVRDTKCFVIATVNDQDLFRKLQAGALSSRFSNVIHFDRPSREQLAMILTREVQRIDGDLAWVQPTLDYCEDQGITDPRRVTTICLCGREMLLTGEYQKLLKDTGARKGE